MTGPGTHRLWSTLLGVRVAPTGAVAFAEESTQVADDGSTTTPFVPTLFLPEPAGSASTAVVGWGALHVVLRLTDRIGPGSIDLTLTRGNVLAELSVSDRPVSFLIPGLKVVRQGTASVTVGSSRGRWIFASDVAVRWQVSSNPTGEPLALFCEGPRGQRRWERVLGPGERRSDVAGPS